MNLRLIRAREGDRVEIVMIHIIMIEEIIKIDIDKIAETGEFNLVDKIEENIEVIIGMEIIEEKDVGVGLEKDHFQGILIIEGMIEA